MTTSIGAFTIKPAAQIRDDLLRSIKNALQQFGGITNIKLDKGSDDWIWANALSIELAVVAVNTQIKADAQMPDTAAGTPAPGQTVGADLVRLMSIYGLAPKGPVGSAGFISLSSSATTLISVGAQLVDAAGLRYQVTVGGTYAVTTPPTLVPVAAIDTGSGTNHIAGDTLSWVSAPPFCAPTQPVGIGGLTGGAEAETNDTARARLLSRLQNPPGTGNWQQVIIFATSSSPLVMAAYVYPAVNGPSTVHVAVVGYASASNKTRDINATVLSGAIVPYILGQMPEYVETVVTTVTNVPTDVSIGLSLPSAPTAQPAGPGGGWVDGTPWPFISGIQTYANVTAVASSTQFTINAPTAPQDGVSHISFLDPTNWTLYQAKVLSHSGSAGAYVVTIDTPFPNIAAALALGGTGPLIFPSAVNTQTYVNVFLNQMALMGPGEKTNNAGVLSRGYRHPLPTFSAPYSLNATVLKGVSNAGPEVLDTSYYFRSTTTPAIPGSVANPPNILVPRHVGFYAI